MVYSLSSFRFAKGYPTHYVEGGWGFGLEVPLPVEGILLEFQNVKLLQIFCIFDSEVCTTPQPPAFVHPYFCGSFSSKSPKERDTARPHRGMARPGVGFGLCDRSKSVTAFSQGLERKNLPHQKKCARLSSVLVGVFNPFEKIVVQLDHFPQVGLKIKIVWNPPPSVFLGGLQFLENDGIVQVPEDT